MKLEPYLFFHGRCEEALNFYKTCLGGEIVGINRYAGSPMDRFADRPLRRSMDGQRTVAGASIACAARSISITRSTGRA